jgi:phosphoglycerate dehydrogenase-like enzyme
MKTLAQMTVGIVGFGRIGRAVARRLQGFGCRILVFDPYMAARNLDGLDYQPAGLEELLGQSDLVTLHCPSTAETRRTINRARLSRMKPGAILVNCSRGDLVDTDALVVALQKGQLAAAALDVFDPEPLPPDHPLRQLDNAIVSSHIASVSAKSMRQLRETVAHTVARAVRGEPLVNVVNGVKGPRFPARLTSEGSAQVAAGAPR